MGTAPAAATDPYRVLQVAPNADLEAIHAAYRRLARRYHPDLNPQPEAAAQMRALNAAYGLLSDPARRAVYDARRYLPHTQVFSGPVAPRPRPVVFVSPPPSTLQRRVDRLVAVIGVLLVLGVGYYAVNVIPYAERQLHAQSDAGLVVPASRQAPTSAAAAAASAPVSTRPAAASVPERLRTDSGLRDFPGTVLVAPSALEPFADLPILRLDAASRGIARYAIYYGDLSSGGASISGLVGRDSFDSATPHVADCAPDASYCAGLAPGEPAAGLPGLELFRAAELAEVVGTPVFATHRVCCNGVFWTLSWFDQRANMTYSIDLSRSVAGRFGSAVAEGDAAAARAVARLAPQLVRLP